MGLRFADPKCMTKPKFAVRLALIALIGFCGSFGVLGEAQTCSAVFDTASAEAAPTNSARSDEDAFLKILADPSEKAPSIDPNPLIDYLIARVASSKSNEAAAKDSITQLGQDLGYLETQRASLAANGVLPTDEFVMLIGKRSEETFNFCSEASRNLKLMLQAKAQPWANQKAKGEIEKLKFMTARAKWLLAYSASVKKTVSLFSTTPNTLNASKLYEVEKHRLLSYQALQDFIVSASSFEIQRTEQQLMNAKSAESEFLSKNPTDEGKRQHLISSYNGVLNEKTLAGYGAPSLGLTIFERLAIESYTEGYYMTINGALWSNKDVAEITPFVQFMTSGLRKLPPYVGTVYRKTRLNPEQLDQHSVGKIVSYPAFISTSVDNGFKSSADVLLKIQSLSGRAIQSFSFHMVENEILFSPGVKFLVTAKTVLADGKVQIDLKEIH